MAFKTMQLQRVILKNHATLTEKWVHDRIIESPAILGLGELIVRDKERPQPRAGRLDLLLQDPDTPRRFEVEIQLGATDETHIIRTIEYWDIERKRYPQYEHCAVIVAEQITSRFLNVIGLFNGSLPLIAIQMSAFARNDEIALVFTTVMNEMPRGLVDSDEEVQPTTDRQYWESESSLASLALVDDVMGILQKVDQESQLSYKKHYIGLSTNQQANNYVIFEPKKNYVRVGIRLEQSETVEQIVKESALDVMPYDSEYGRYRIRVNKSDLPTHQIPLQKLFTLAFEVNRA